jgi:integrase/recombinase XerD
MTDLAPSLQAFFTDRLIGQRAASPNTIDSYKTTFGLLLRFASQRTGTSPSQLDIDDLDAPLVAAFLGHLETERHNTPRTRNNRLAAIHSLFAYLALHHPEHAGTIQHPTGARHPHQTHPTEPPHLPDRTRSRRAPPSMRPTTLDRPT